MNIQSISNSRFGLVVAMGIGKLLPPAIGYRLSQRLADRIANRKADPMVRAVRANQWVVSQGELSSVELDQAVRDTFRLQARYIYTLYRNLNNPTAMQRMVEMSPHMQEIIEGTRQGKINVVITGIHLSNFDLVAYAAARQGLRALGLGVDNPGGGYRWQYEMRRRSGFEVVPASMVALREAARRLQDGKSVLTGLDRPLPESKYRPLFFNRPAALPVLHIHLALKARVPVYVVAAIMRADGRYHISSSDPIHMQPHPDRHTEIIQNAETVLQVAEDYIRQAPRQWAMFYPVWPEALDEMP